MTVCESADACVHPWYLVHVPTCKEALMASLIERMSPDSLAYECFQPTLCNTGKTSEGVGQYRSIFSLDMSL